MPLQSLLRKPGPFHGRNQEGLGLRVGDIGFRIGGLRVYGLGLRVWDIGFRIGGLGLGVWDLGFGI